MELSNRTPSLYRLAEQGDIKNIAQLLNEKSTSEKQILFNTPDPNTGYPPLLYAAIWANFEVIQLLVMHGADPNVRSEDGQETAFLLALIDHDMERASKFIYYLLEWGAHPNCTNSNGNSPLHWAALTQNFKVLYHLLRIFTFNKLNIQNNHQGKSPLEVLIEACKTRYCRLAPLPSGRPLIEPVLFAFCNPYRDRSDRNRTLYTFLLHGIDIKEALANMDIPILLEKDINKCIEKAKIFIKACEYYGHSSEIIARFVLGSREEIMTFISAYWGLTQVCRHLQIKKDLWLPQELKDLISEHIEHNTSAFFKFKLKKLNAPTKEAEFQVSEISSLQKSYS